MTAIGQAPDGRTVHQITIGSDRLTAKILTWGAILQDVRLGGVPHSLTIGTEALEPYLTKMASFGGLVGPVVNRIAGATAWIGDEVHHFEANHEGRNTLHSGSAGTHRKLWAVAEQSEDAVTLEITLPDREGGFPGNRKIMAIYAVEGRTLTLKIEGHTDAPTFLNFANHSYWSLDNTGTIDGHRLQIDASRFLIHDETGLPTGQIAGVEGTPYDFRKPHPLSLGRDYDNNMILADARRDQTEVATLTGTTGVTMRLSTTEPGLQLYDAYKMTDLGVTDHSGRPLAPHRGLALEAQGWPDAPNHSGWPSIRLDPGETYRQVTSWTFSSEG